MLGSAGMTAFAWDAGGGCVGGVIAGGAGGASGVYMNPGGGAYPRGNSYSCGGNGCVMTLSPSQRRLSTICSTITFSL